MEKYFLEHIKEILNESLLHTGTILPLLFLVFLLVEAVSHRSRSSRLAKAFSQPFIGPVVAAVLGLVPQCGFSVVATTLFLEGMIPIGSLLSAYISTSDEALPVMLADRASFPWVLPLLATKLIWGTVAGVCINAAVLYKTRSKIGPNASDTCDKVQVQMSLNIGHGTIETPSSGCSHNCTSTKLNPGEVVSHALSRTLRTASMIFVLSALFNVIGHAAQGRISAALSRPGLWQPIVAAFVGLVPSCATSVALAEGFRTGILSFPATVSGLTSNSGLGLLILTKEAKNKTDVITVVALLLFAAVLAGFLASMILPPSYMIHSELGWLRNMFHI